MTDYCLKLDTDEQFDDLMLQIGLGVEVEDEDGLVTVEPSSYLVLFDRIGPITKDDVTYPEYYVNLRLLMEPTEEQNTALEAVSVDPSQPQYRVWA